MYILAWIGLVIMILKVIIKLISSFTEKKISNRVILFISTLIHGALLYFFFMYLFR